jgi:hypothetical protein
MRFRLIALSAAALTNTYAAVTGTVTDDAGKPVAQAFVRYVNAADPALEADVFTDAAGKYALALPLRDVSGLPPHPQPAAKASASAPARYDLAGRAVKPTSPTPLVARGDVAPMLPLPKAAAAPQDFFVTVYGKGVYPAEGAKVSAADGDAKDFKLKAVTLWNADRGILRDNLANSRRQFEKTKQGRVVFLGGSITHNAGWRDSICAYLKKKYPQTVFDFINAGIPSVGVNMHAFRMERDVFFKGKVDLLFLESAVNDTINYVPSIERTRAYEGIVRHARRNNPDLDIVFMYFAADVFYPNVAAGKPIPQVADYEKTGWRYGISSINLAQYVAEHYTWEQFGSNVHPGPLGQGVYYNGIRHLLDQSWADTSSIVAQTSPHFVPAKMQDSLCYYLGRLDTIQKAQIVNGWKRIASWTPAQGGTRDGFFDVPVIEATAPGDTVKLAFTGTAIGIVVPAGPDVGMLDYSIDGKINGSLDQFTQWSSALNIPWTYLFSGDLSMGPHELRIVTSKKKNAASTGYACRIIRFVVNGPVN